MFGITEKMFSGAVQAYCKGVAEVREEMITQLISETETYLGKGWDE